MSDSEKKDIKISAIKNKIKLSKKAKIAITDFLLGKEQIDFQHLIVNVDKNGKTFYTFERVGGILDKIKEKFEQLKAEHPWFAEFCNFIEIQIAKIRQAFTDANGSISKAIENFKRYLFGYDVKKDGLAGLLGQTEHVKGIIDEIKDIFDGIFDDGKNKKKKSSVLSGITDFLGSIFGEKSGFLGILRKGPNILDLLKSFFLYITDKSKRDNKRIKNGFKYCLLVIVGSIPAGLVGVLFKDKLEALISPTLLAVCFIITALMLLFVRKKDGKRKDDEITYKDALIIGGEIVA